MDCFRQVDLPGLIDAWWDSGEVSEKLFQERQSQSLTLNHV